MHSQVIVELKEIRKEFPGVVALNKINLKLETGKIHALVGENGAGKSTLMKILSGTYTNYEGELLIDGMKVHFRSEKDALKKGIAIVPQELNPIPDLTIAENIFLGREPLKCKGVIDKKRLFQQAKEYLDYLEISYDPHTIMRKLSIAQKQMVEIIKAISRNCRVIILDEPTSALTSIETKYLFNQMALLKEKGISMVFISHKLDEVFAVSDDVTVLRDGELIGYSPIEDITSDRLISMMVGREVKDIYPSVSEAGKEEILELRSLTSNGVYKDINLKLNKGEILGFAGMMGAGRSEIARSIFGLDHYDAGEIYLEGKSIKIKKVGDSIKAGIAMVTEDRSIYGFVGGLSIKDNIVLPNSDIFADKGILKRPLIKQKIEDICKLLAIKAPTIETKVGTLSGGNQQKVVLSKWLIRDVKILIMDEPTKGIDVGSKQEIYKLIVKLASEGMAVIFISSEMQEIVALSHRVVIVANGSIVGELNRDEVTQEKIMKMIIEGGLKHGND